MRIKVISIKHLPGVGSLLAQEISSWDCWIDRWLEKIKFFGEVFRDALKKGNISEGVSDWVMSQMSLELSKEKWLNMPWHTTVWTEIVTISLGGGRGLERTTLSLCHFVTIGLGGGGVKANLDNVTKYEVFFFWRLLLVSYVYVVNKWICFVETNLKFLICYGIYFQDNVLKVLQSLKIFFLSQLIEL